ncbi:PKD domain-containing protein [Olleya sp. Bg11-27]|uniref:PKD domain-containing protein n=1 Tax=Olleya sp. Bg11-27 TaxID=2058135 RepID=UPI000C318377|nr:PKD domain-containing protein [Olleya sp. Bg11-27]AUC74207.1 PKD domain-containing protein [Olleya sp. Bg11-27]
MKNLIKNSFLSVVAVATLSMFNSCEDLEQFEPIGANSIADETPPNALFTVSQGQGVGDAWRNYSFANASTSATTYAWDFGNGQVSSEVDGATTYPGEGTYTVSLTASDNLGVVSSYSETFNVVEPDEPLVADPILVNADFDKLPKNNGSSSDCSCSGWDNDDIGEQGESSSGNGGSDNVVKFDNNEPDHVYQEFAVTPNADYRITLVSSFKSLTVGGAFPAMLEVRVLAGAGYIANYTPTYYATATEFPSSGYGYTSVTQVEDVANNLLVESISNPNNEDYNTYTYTFNAGANDSVALFIRGVGGDSIGTYGYTGGDEEIRADSVTIEAVN